MILSHLPSTLLFSICLAVYVVVRLTISRSILLPLIRVILGLSIGVLISAVYWLPALLTQGYIHAEAWWTWYYDFHLWFFPVRSLSDFRGDNESLLFDKRVFFAVSVTTVMFTILWIAAMRQLSIRHNSRIVGYACLVGTACIFMTPASAFVWENFPPLAKVQFPSRLGMVVDLGTALVAAEAIQQCFRRRWVTSVATVVTLALLIWCFASAALKSRLDPFNDPAAVSVRDDRVRNGVDPPEYATRWSRFDPKAEDNSLYISGMPALAYDVGAGTIGTSYWGPRKLVLSVSMNRATALTVRQFFFPNWTAKIIGGSVLPLTPNRDTGLISLNLPSGAYQVSLELRPLLQEYLGFGISGIGVIALGAVAYFAAARR